MNDRKFVRDAIEKISVIKEYKEKYGEEDIIAYYNTYGTFVGIEEYLKECAAKK